MEAVAGLGVSCLALTAYGNVGGFLYKHSVTPEFMSTKVAVRLRPALQDGVFYLAISRVVGVLERVKVEVVCASIFAFPPRADRRLYRLF